MKLEKTFLGSKIKQVSPNRQVLQMQNSVNFVFVTSDNKYLLSKQFRAGINQEVYGLYGGYIDNGESCEECIVRETYEETGLMIKKSQIEILERDLFVSIGYSTERNTIALIKLNKKASELDVVCHDEDEDITPYFCKNKMELHDKLNKMNDMRATLISFIIKNNEGNYVGLI